MNNILSIEERFNKMMETEKNDDLLLKATKEFVPYSDSVRLLDQDSLKENAVFLAEALMSIIIQVSTETTKRDLSTLESNLLIIAVAGINKIKAKPAIEKEFQKELKKKIKFYWLKKWMLNFILFFDKKFLER